ncbi:MAG: restriction endonuclease subunit S [Bacteroidetes bacterium]|nr:restriction endonuclease subunit S [Bacteroidota bacterium]
MKFGLSDKVITKIQEVFESIAKVDKAFVFGSRAKGNFKEGSDIDIAIKGQEINFKDILFLTGKLDDLNLPYKIDLINYHTIKEPALVEHIDRVGIEFYSRWKEYRLGEIAEITSSKRIFYSDYVSEGIPFFRSKEIIEKSLGESSGAPLYISNKRYIDIKEKFGAPVDGDLLISAVGERAGIPYVVKNQGDFYFKDGNLIWLRNIKSDLNIMYFNYWLKSSIGQSTLDSIMIGSAQKVLTIIGLKNLLVLLPPIIEQTVIASILTSLDDKIDLLHRQNKTLEQLAETLFRQWFVEEEWKGCLSEFVKVQGGYAFKSNDFKETGFAGIIKITNVSMAFVDISRCDYVDESAVKNLDTKFKIKSGDFLIAMTGAEIGKIGIVEKTEKEIWLNQRVGKLEAKVPYGNIIGYLALKSREGQDHILNTCSGSAQENISTTGIEEMIFASYNEKKAICFGEEVQPLFEKIITNLNQIRTLTQLRDTLLPKLMSGEVRVN